MIIKKSSLFSIWKIIIKKKKEKKATYPRTPLKKCKGEIEGEIDSRKQN